jgi:N-acetyltransferase
MKESPQTPLMCLTYTPLAAGPVRLVPLSESHRPALRVLAQDGAIWRHWIRAAHGEAFNSHFDWEMGEIAAKRRLIYTVEHHGEAVGETAYIDARPAHGGVEIGGTWYTPRAQGTAVNPICKYLMLRHAFACGAERVELKTDALNLHSRAAIEKLGAAFEGTFRNHLRRPDGSLRDTVWYSILKEEWPAVRARLEERISAAGEIPP